MKSCPSRWWIRAKRDKKKAFVRMREVKLWKNIVNSRATEVLLNPTNPKLLPSAAIDVR